MYYKVMKKWMERNVYNSKVVAQSFSLEEAIEYANNHCKLNDCYSVASYWMGGDGEEDEYNKTEYEVKGKNVVSEFIGVKNIVIEEAKFIKPIIKTNGL